MNVRWKRVPDNGATAKLMGMTLLVFCDDGNWYSTVNRLRTRMPYPDEQSAKLATLDRAEEYLRIMAAEIKELRRNPGTL